jgi:PAS domain S-box-containing protein
MNDAVAPFWLHGRRLRAEREAERIFEMSPALLAVAGFDGYLRRFNPAFEVFGYSREELLSRPWAEFAHPNDRERMLQAAASLELGADVVELENRVICRDGSLRWVEWSTRVVPEEGLFYAAGRDMTESRRAVEEQAALRRVATLVARETALDKVLAALGREVGEVLAVHATHVGRYDGDDTVVSVAQWGSYAGVEVGERFPLQGDSVSARVLRTGQPARMDSYEDAPGVIASTVRKIGIRFSIGVPISVEGRLWGVMIATSKDVPFPTETEARLQAFTDLVATAISNATARARVRVLANEQAALRRVATLVAQGVPPAEIFSAVSEEVSRLFSSHGATVDLATAVRFDPGPEVVLVGASTILEGLPLGARWEPMDLYVSSRVLRTGRPARIDESELDAVGGPVAQSLRQMGLLSQVGTPIIVEGELWGAMTMNAKEALPSDTEERLEKFTELLGTAIANAESRSELAASRLRIVAASDDARRRIERDLHDGVQQRLVSVGLELHELEAAMPPNEELQGQAARVTSGLDSALEDLVEIARGIHPAILSQGGLSPALKGLARRSGVPVQLDADVDSRLPEQVEVAAYYIVSEALTNAAKHACASVVHVDAVAQNDTLCLSIRDDGIGGADPRQGSGLLGLQDRVEALGGRLKVESARGSGTSLGVTLPLKEPMLR